MDIADSLRSGKKELVDSSTSLRDLDAPLAEMMRRGYDRRIRVPNIDKGIMWVEVGM